MPDAPKKRRRRIWWIIGSILVLLFVFMLWRGFKGRQSGALVRTAKSEVRDIYSRVSESGVIQPTIEVPTAPDVSGEVVKLFVQEGMKVKRGDLLVTIRPDDYQAQVEQAEASLARTRAAYNQAKAAQAQAQAQLLQDSVNMERNRQLFKDKVISDVEWENLKLAYEVSKSQVEASRYNAQSALYQIRSAEATLKQATQNLDRTNIYASMDGTITMLNVELGQRVVGTSMMAGTEILRIADLSEMEVVVEVNENDIVNVSLGDSARVEVDAFPDKVFFGTVREIAYSASVAGLATTDQVTNFEVKVRIDPQSYGAKPPSENRELPVSQESPFRPGMTALVEVYTQYAPQVVAVPIQSVTLRPDSTGGNSREVVFRLTEESTVEKIPVTTGIADDQFIEIKEGVDPETEVVIGPYTVLTKTLQDGMGVQKESQESTRRRFRRSQ